MSHVIGVPGLTLTMFHRTSYTFRRLRANRSWLTLAIMLITLLVTCGCTRSNASTGATQPVAAQTSQHPQLQRGIQSSQPPASQAPSDVSAEVAKIYDANAGSSRSMALLANAYEKGEGAPHDLQQAIAWYRKAADAGSAYAMYQLGRIYTTGSGVQRDYKQALAWYRKAAAGGNADAMYSLGQLYEAGSGVREDVQQAVVWYTEAAQHGNRGARAALTRLGETFEDHP